MQANPRARTPRGALTALAVSLAAGVVFFARRERGAEVTPPTIEAGVLLEQSPDAPAPPIIPDLPQTPSSAVSRAALEQLAASADLRAAVSSNNTATANGRLASAQALRQAEQSAIHVHDLVVQSVSLARTAADSAPLDPRERDQAREDLEAMTDRTLMLAGRLRDTRLQAISTARRMILFMEENAGAYEVRDGGVHFSNPADQVQFSHFQVNTSRVLGQENLLRSETAGALAEQEQLVARLSSAAPRGDVASQ